MWAETDMPSVQTFRSVDDLFDALHEFKVLPFPDDAERAIAVARASASSLRIRSTRPRTGSTTATSALER